MVDFCRPGHKCRSKEAAKKNWSQMVVQEQETNMIEHSIQGRSRQSGWSGFGRTTIFQGKNKVPFYKRQVINKSSRVFFRLVQLVLL